MTGRDEVRLDGSQIREVRADGLEYVDDESHTKFIDFAICHANYVWKRTSRAFWEQFKEANKQSVTDEDYPRYVERVSSWKEVGQRQIVGPPWDDGPYIIFHTQPAIRFDLTEEQYGHVCGMIRVFGWRTFDRS